MIRLAIIRHGHTSWNRAGRIQGRTDIPLAPDAVDALSGLKLPADWVDANLVSSPLVRAQQTAELISGCTPRTESALIEMDWGDWEGQVSREIGSDPNSGFRHVDQWGWNFRPPNGESPDDLRSRLVPWLSSLPQDTVAVCHIGIMRTLLALAHQWQFQGPAPFEIKRNRLYLFDIRNQAESEDAGRRQIAISDPPCVRLVSASDMPDEDG